MELAHPRPAWMIVLIGMHLGVNYWHVCPLISTPLNDRIVDVAPTFDGFDVTVHRGQVRAHRHN